jgi:hypothetical protein
MKNRVSFCNWGLLIFYDGEVKFEGQGMQNEPAYQVKVKRKHTKRNLEVTQEELLQVNSSLFKQYRDCVCVQEK